MPSAKLGRNPEQWLCLLSKLGGKELLAPRRRQALAGLTDEAICGAGNRGLDR